MTSPVKHLAVIDCQTAGISGDMFLSAMLDLLPSTGEVIEAIESVQGYHKGCRKLEVRVEEVKRRGFRAKKAETVMEESDVEKTGAELLEIVAKCADALSLSSEAKQFASKSISTLVEAETKVHGGSAQKTHLHEAGSVDTTAEIIGVAVAAERLSLFNNTVVCSTPVAVGGGLFRFSHGTVQSPAPATLDILRSHGFPIVGGPIESELTTPTGASLLVNLAKRAERFYPPMRPTLVGCGAGAKDFAEMPNLLRIVLGEPLDYGLLSDEIIQLETNLDDVPGEVIGHAVERLLNEGARDVCMVPMFTKKNRPGQILKVIADRENAEYLSRILVEETGSIGLRFYPCTRRVLARETVTVELSIDGATENVRVKISKDSLGEILQVKPEYDDMAKLAAKTRRPIRWIEELATMKAREILTQ